MQKGHKDTETYTHTAKESCAHKEKDKEKILRRGKDIEKETNRHKRLEVSGTMID